MSDIRSFTIGEDVPLGGELAAVGAATAPISDAPVTPLQAAVNSQSASSRIVGDTATAAARPEWLPARFATPADMAKAFAELEAKSGALKTGETPPAETKPPEAAKPQEPAQPKFAGIEQELQTGTLKPETISELEKAGLPRSLIEGALASQQFAAQALAGMVHESFGGESGWKEAQARAAAELSPAEREFVNTLLTSRNYAKTSEGVRFLKSKLGGLQSPGYGRSDVPRDDGYKNPDEMFAAQRDPRYGTDPVYTREFERKSELMVKAGRFR